MLHIMPILMEKKVLLSKITLYSSLFLDLNVLAPQSPFHFVLFEILEKVFPMLCKCIETYNSCFNFYALI